MYLPTYLLNTVHTYTYLIKNDSDGIIYIRIVKYDIIIYEINLPKFLIIMEKSFQI